MTNFRTFIAGLAAILTMAVATSTASAATSVTPALWKIERLSDTDARITMEGVLDVFLPNNFDFEGAASVTGAVGTAVAPTGDFLIGGIGIRLAFIRANALDLSLNVGGDAGPGASASGALLISLASGQFAAVGTSGDVYNTAISLPNAQVIASYEIISAVPLPAGGVLLFSGLAGIFVIARRRRHFA